MFENIKLEKIIDSQSISEKVKELAGMISADYREKNPLLVCVLYGSFIFMSDIVRKIDIDIKTDFIRISSYSKGNVSEPVVLVSDISADIENEHVIIIEDIVDTGLSVQFLQDLFLERKAGSVSCCAMIDKTERRERNVKIDYYGFRIEEGFVVGYGMDYMNLGRNLKDIYIMKNV